MIFMKLRSQKIRGIVFILIGVVGWLLGVFLLKENEQSNFVSGFFAGMVTIGIVSALKAARLMKDPEKAQDYETMQKDERTVFVANKARSMALYISVLAQCVAALTAYVFFKNVIVCKTLCYATCFQCIVYYIYWIIYNKKY